MTTIEHNDSVMEHLGAGVCIFRNAINLDWEWLYQTARRLVEEDIADMYTPTVHPETGKPALINKSGYIFSDETFLGMPGRCSSAHQRKDVEIKNLLNFLEKSKDTHLLQYLAKFPLAYKNIWWKVKGHIVRYEEKHSQYLGVHSDTSADYVYGFPQPSDQLATRNTVSSIVYFNDCTDDMGSATSNSFSGGHHVFDDLGITYLPKKGDILMFPSNFIASHQVTAVTRGSRYSYLGWYSHGSPNAQYNEAIVDPIKEPELAQVATNIYMPTLRGDFRKYLEANPHDCNPLAYSLVMEGF